MSVILFEPAIANYMNSTVGPLGQYMARRANDVRERALSNASGVVINIDSGDLLANLSAEVTGTPAGAVASVGSSAEHRGANYPAFVHRAGMEPGGWLRQALRDEFPGV